MEKKLPASVVNWLMPPGGTRRRIAKPDGKFNGGFMPDFARKPISQQAVRQPARQPVGEQAVRLSSFAAKIRFLKFVFGFNWKAVKG